MPRRPARIGRRAASPRDASVMLELASGGPAVALDVVRKSMNLAARDLAAEFNAEARVFAENVKTERALTDAMLAALVRADPTFRRKAEAQKRRAAALRESTRRRRRVRPRLAVEIQPRVFTGSIGGVRTPAYNYDWNWFSTSGRVDSKTHTANRATGVLDLYTYLSGRRSGSVDLRTAVGFYLRPLTETGLLRVDTAPAYTLDLNTYSAFASSSTSAWLGLFIGEYAVGSNTYIGAKVSTQNSLGSISTWWSGSSLSRSSSGYSMSSTIHVDSSHWYAIWVWAGIRGSVAEEGWLSNSGVISSLDVTVPSFTWTLY